MSSARFQLPFLAPGQSQKEITHNEAVQLLEAATQPMVEGAPLNSPPPTPAIGQQFLVGAGGAGAWSSPVNSWATWTAGGWRYLQPVEGMSVYDRSSGLDWRYTSGAWRQGVDQVSEVRVGGHKVLGARQAAIPDPAGGSVIDSSARTALIAVLNALRQHGLIAG